MSYNVKFLKGTAAQYNGLVSKDVNTFYYVDGTDLYLGSIKLSNDADLNAAITRIAANETKIGDISKLTTVEKSNLTLAINELKTELSALIGGETGGISDMIAAVTGNKADLTTDAKENLVAAINEIDANVDQLKLDSKVTMNIATTPTEGYLKTYEIYQGGSATTNLIGKIDIPKDLVVESGKIVKNPEGQPEGTYIELTIANKTSDKIYINVANLVDVYTAAQNATEVQLAFNGYEVSATLVNGGVSTEKLANNAITNIKLADNAVQERNILDKNVTKSKLSDTLQASIDLADSALQAADITTGSTQGTIAVEGVDVKVNGLKSAAYTDSNSYDAAGSASAAEANAKTYTNEEIQKLDADISSADVEAGKGIKVQVVEEDGKITSVSVSGNYNEAYDAKGSAANALKDAKAYVDTALTWGTIA